MSKSIQKIDINQIHVDAGGEIAYKGIGVNLTIENTDKGRWLCGVRSHVGSKSGFRVGKPLANVTHLWHKPQALAHVIAGYLEGCPCAKCEKEV